MVPIDKSTTQMSVTHDFDLIYTREKGDHLRHINRTIVAILLNTETIMSSLLPIPRSREKHGYQLYKEENNKEDNTVDNTGSSFIHLYLDLFQIVLQPSFGRIVTVS